MCVPTWVYVQMLTEARRFPQRWNYRCLWVIWCGCWEPNLDLLWGQQTPLTTEPWKFHEYNFIAVAPVYNHTGRTQNDTWYKVKTQAKLRNMMISPILHTYILKIFVWVVLSESVHVQYFSLVYVEPEENVGSLDLEVGARPLCGYSRKAVSIINFWVILPIPTNDHNEHSLRIRDY